MSRAGQVIDCNDAASYNRALSAAQKKLVVVDFFATWCGPCKHIAPKFDALAAKYASSCVFLRVDVDQNQETARAAGVSSMPTFHFIHNHSTIESFSGADATKLEETIERLSKQYSRSFLSGPGAGRAGGDEDVPSGGPRRNPWADRNFVPPGMRSLEEAKVQSSAAQNQQQQQRTAPNVPERTNLTSTVPVVKPTPAPAPPIAGNNDESAAGKEESTDPAIVSLTNQLLEMGFDKSRIQAAIVVGKTTDVVAALEWLSDSKNDNVVAPPPESKSSSHSASPSSSAAASAGPGKGLGKTSLSQEEREDLELLRSTLDLKTMKPKTPSEQNTEAARQSAGPAEARPTRSAQEEALARRRAEYWAKRDNEDVIKAKEQYEQNKRMQEAQEALQAQKAKFDAEQGELRRKRELQEKEAAKKRMAALLVEEKARRAKEAEERARELARIRAEKAAAAEQAAAARNNRQG